MKKIAVMFVLLFATLNADLVLVVKEGWQLIGLSSKIDNMSQFSKENVEEIWHFDASTQKWLGFSPDEETQTKMSDKGIAPLTMLENWHGFWIKSKKEWVLTLTEASINSVPSDENEAHDTIELKKGWNLISLPVDSVVSADIFDGMTVWKYNNHQEWELFNKSDTVEEKEKFSPLGHIKNSDGIWVKADEDISIAVMKEASKLHNFKTQEEMEGYITQMAEIYQRPYCGMEPFFRGGVAVDDAVISIEEAGGIATSVPTSADFDSTSVASESIEAKNATQTNLQEADVDEADILKHNGKHIFYISRENYNHQTILVTSFSDIIQPKSEPLNVIKLEENQNIDSMYLVENRLVVLSSSYAEPSIYEGDEAEIGITPYYYYGQNQLNVDIFDISDILNITKKAHYKIDGNMVTSRVIGDNLYLVSTFTPQVNISYPKTYVTLPKVCEVYFNFDEVPDYRYPETVGSGTASSEEVSEAVIVDSVEEVKVVTAVKSKVVIDNSNDYSACYNIEKEYESNRYYRYDYESPIVKIVSLLPMIEKEGGQKESLIKPLQLYAPSKQQQNATMTTISHLKIKEGKYEKSNSFMGYSSTQYASSKALYLVSNQYPIYYNFNDYKTRSSIYKFSLDEALNYKGIGSVFGTPLNQYALSEYQDILRIATTEGFSWGNQGTTNSIYTLKEQDEKLAIQGVLSGLGKENETIRGVRFMQDKGYVVTFKQTDPFYTIDLSNPLAPLKVGELEVDGYSGYLHPIGGDKVLGIGRDADKEGRIKGVKLELFDISDFANPTSLDSIVLEDNSYSDIENNPKILAYRGEDKLFAFPYATYGNRENSYQNRNYLGVWQVVENGLKSYKPLETNNTNYGDKRGIIFDMNESSYATLFSNSEIITNKIEEQ